MKPLSVGWSAKTLADVEILCGQSVFIFNGVTISSYQDRRVARRGLACSRCVVKINDGTLKRWIKGLAAEVRGGP
ncbi:hypothetical protein KCP70_00550 [Salmonella enterica subsp. enterica]|nr:hypothetical protein KCP70_00550 [Salmonella enterica subsp. enterica]